MLISDQAIPERYSKDKLSTVDQYFAMGRGHQKDGIDVPSLVRAHPSHHSYFGSFVY